ncbi:MAG: alanine--tRNA ligase [Planctomycetota bacterium]|nr:MAG: alanine--tRNA ligase [Planctomycetota bacterium]GDY07482.1 alanine--tRNA ligase [Planctomycetia bacterium]
MKTDELREKFLAFFETKGCVRRASDVLIPRDDKTVLFTPAGMNQFKNQFLGIGPIDFTRATTCQKCLRTGDISNVGVTAYHHTFFEMLGNFSFGDYFKKEAIHWAWEFLTTKKWLGLDGERLSVTVYLDDDEAYGIWHDEVKVPANRITRCDESENFWPASAPSQGPDGVCGPCSEIYYLPPGSEKTVEIWNLVFTQFNRVGAPPNNLQPLPKKNIDTGMGLERCASTLQGVLSNFEIDILKPMCVAAGNALGLKYDYAAPHGRACRRIADHVRACTFAIHEGALPGSDKENYIVRLLLRRAALEGYLLGKQDPFLHTLVPAIVAGMKAAYPEITQTVESVANVIREEEQQFLTIVDRGMPKFQKLADKAKSSSGVLSGEAAFDLHQTDGFLIELTESLAAGAGLKVDRAQFEVCVKQHEAKSGSGAFANSVMSAGPMDALRKQGGTEFLGYDSTQASGCKIVGIIADGDLVNDFATIGHEQSIGIALDKTPLYGESGGQVGDVGTLTADGVEFQVLDTQKDGDLWLHIGTLKKGKLTVGQTVTATVDAERRAGIRRAHSATHILHHALRQTLGSQATQRGSKVDRDVLRFDFTHGKPVSDDELQTIETEINARIAEGATVTTKLMPIAEARELGAMALFGEKYPDNVRVVRMGDWSIELCGGMHLTNSGQVGFCKLVAEEPVAKGVRRISAVTGAKALERTRQTESLVKDLCGLLKSPADELAKRITALQDELRDAKRELAQHASHAAAGAIDTLIAQAESIGGVRIVTHLVENATRDSVREMIDLLRDKASPAAILLGAVIDGKVALTAAVSKDLIARGLHAGDCVKSAAKIVGGGGGGRPDMAEAGGKDPSKLADALKAGTDYFRSKLG